MSQESQLATAPGKSLRSRNLFDGFQQNGSLSRVLVRSWSLHNHNRGENENDS